MTSGSVFVYSGGLVSGLTDNGTVQVYSGGTTTDTVVTSAGDLELFGGTNNVVTISSGGFVDFFGGSLNGVQIAGGQLEVDAVLGSAGANFVAGTAGQIYDDENTITAPISGFAAGDAIILDKPRVRQRWHIGQHHWRPGDRHDVGWQRASRYRQCVGARPGGRAQ